MLSNTEVKAVDFLVKKRDINCKFKKLYIMNYLLITFILVLLGVVVYQYFKINKLNNDKIDYKVKYESIKSYVEESKAATAQKTNKAEKADKAVKRGRKPKK